MKRIDFGGHAMFGGGARAEAAKKEANQNKRASKVRVSIHQEEATSRESASVYIHDGETLISVVKAKVEIKPGADGGRYPCVTLTEHKFNL